jgi:hypothetical protein
VGIGDLSCPWCPGGCKSFAAIKQGNVVSLGCRKCAWDWRVAFKEEGRIWVPS